MDNNLILQKFYEKKYFSLYSCCIPVKGASRGVIYDLQRGEVHYVPNVVLDILDQYTNKSILEGYNQSEKDNLIKVLNYLFQNDIIFFTNTELSNFPAISGILNEIPHKIEFLSIEIESYPSKYNIFNNIDLYNVSEMIIIQSTRKKLLRNLNKLLFSIAKSTIQNIYLIIPDNVYLPSDLNNLIDGNLRIKKIIVFDAKNETIKNNITFTDKGLKDILCRRINSMNDFVINTKSYIESKSRNLYFNKRVYIDKKGFIKHSYDDLKTYGNINHSKLETIVFSLDFEELFKVTKDSIEECQKCEFRYICPDNRIPNKIGYKKYSHETSCNYNPNTLEWKE